MPTTIPKHHIKRLFPFDFYYEIQEQMPNYIFYNPAFLLAKQQNLNKTQQEKMFNAIKNDHVLDLLTKNNIVNIEPYGEMLLLDHCCKTEDVDHIIVDQKNRNEHAMTIMIVQLYDQHQQPIFSEKTHIHTIAELKRITYKDPQIFIGILIMEDNNTQVATLKIPHAIDNKIFEKV